MYIMNIKLNMMEIYFNFNYKMIFRAQPNWL